jgi:hypothetical protein
MENDRDLAATLLTELREIDDVSAHDGKLRISGPTEELDRFVGEARFARHWLLGA